MPNDYDASRRITTTAGRSTISRTFKDISLTFRRHPVTNDIMPLKNEDAIKRSVVNLVRTRMGERFFQPILGANVENQMFENQTPEIAASVETEIRVLLENYEPRIETSEVLVSYPMDSNEMLVNIRYDIVGLPFPTQNIEFLLQPTRV